MATAIGWCDLVPPNGFSRRPRDGGASNSNPAGLATVVPDVEIETTPEHYNLVAGDPTCEGWTRRFDDPGVVGLRDQLEAHNGIPDLEVVEPHQVERAVELFYRDGFVVVTAALHGERLTDLQAATDRVVAELVEVDPDHSIGGGAGGLPHRYSFGSTSATRHRLHEPAWANVIDLETTTPILTAIFGSENYVVGGGGGDVALPGAIEYQGLHSDNIWTEPFDPIGGLTTRDMPVPVVTINFPMVDLTTANGPIRQIPGTQRSHDPIPTLADEPLAMKRSTLCPVPAGSALIRDNRTWHGGTPNLSREVRALPNIEYHAPWFRSEIIERTMPYEVWRELSPHARRVCRLVSVGPGETVLGAGFTHPRARVREQHLQQELDALGPRRAAEYIARH
ncbi:MAG: phytanoyl-CoA dioxygenase family protein [Acidimicrobiia bacterium]|nr:phytanoyl-CoA dioxygenase family protein [Acidimicrobiia bacterium]